MVQNAVEVYFGTKEDREILSFNYTMKDMPTIKRLNDDL